MRNKLIRSSNFFVEIECLYVKKNLLEVDLGIKDGVSQEEHSREHVIVLKPQKNLIWMVRAWYVWYTGIILNLNQNMNNVILNL